MLKGGVIVNGDKAIGGFRPGWVIGYSNAAPEIKLGGWTNIKPELPPHQVLRFTDQEGSFASLDDRPATVSFFIAAVRFGDGTTWNADLGKIAASAPSGGANH